MSGTAGAVPATLIRPLVQEFVGESEVMNGPLPRLAVLANKTNLHYDTIQHIWSGTAGTLEFEVVDRILCAINANQAWYQSPLREIYYSCALDDYSRVESPKNRCKRRGCSNPLPPKTWPGGQPQKYCSRTCRDAASRSRSRDKVRVGRYSNPLDRCVNGHDWNDENTYISPGGKRLCRVCMRIRQAEVRRRARMAA